MKIMKYLSLIAGAAMMFSCEKQEIEYNATPVSNMAEFQLFYYVPVTAVAANNITKVEVNDQLYSNYKAPLNTYNGIPSGATGKFFTVNPGNINIKLYQGTDMATKAYDNTASLSAKKQMIFVHSFTQPPVVIDAGFPYKANVAEYTDSTAWVRFYNFMYETAGVPTTLKLQYQYLSSRTNLPVNVGKPVGFGEATDWIPVTVVKTDIISAGSRTISFKIKQVDAGGNPTDDLQVMGTGGKYAAYTGTATLSIGRRYNQIIAGFRAVASPNATVRTFTAL